jgi:hypothetical protein
MLTDKWRELFYVRLGIDSAFLGGREERLRRRCGCCSPPQLIGKAGRSGEIWTPDPIPQDAR